MAQLFTEPIKLFDEKEWKSLGDILWYKVIDEEKTAHKLMKPWHTVITCLQRYQTEKKITAVASATLEGQPIPDLHQLGVDYDPCPPTGDKIIVQIAQSSSESLLQPTAPPSSP